MTTNPIKLITHHSKGLLEDLLDYGDYAHALVNAIKSLQAENTGLTIGIFGDWGSGKSSILRMISEILKPEKKIWERRVSPYLVIEFDAWRYADQQNLWVAFLQRILKGIEKELGPIKITIVNFRIWLSHIDHKKLVNAIISFLIRLLLAVILISYLLDLIPAGLLLLQRINVLPVLDWFKDALEVTTIPAVLWLIFSGSIKQIYNGFKQIFTFKLSLPPDFFKQTLNTNILSLADQFQQDLVSVVNSVGKTDPIVVLIDDLDRAPVDQIVPILESIKHFGMAAPTKSKPSEKSRITFILAADRRTIERAIASHYDKFWTQLDQIDMREMYAREYFEKIVQIFFEIPPLSTNQLNGLLMGSTEDAVGSIGWACQEARQVFTQAPKQNPRAVIQAYNSFQYLWGVIDTRKLPIAGVQWFPQILAALITVRYIWPSVFEKIVRWPELFFDLHGLASGNENQNCKKSEIEEIISLGCPGDSNSSMIDTIKRRYPDLLKLLAVIKLKDVSLDELFAVITLSKDQRAPKGPYLIEVGEALMSGDPTLIKFTFRTNPGEIMKDRVLWLTEFLQDKTLIEDKNGERKSGDADLEDRMIRAIFALGRLEDARGIESLKKIIDHRDDHSDAILARAVFALAHLAR